MQAALFFSPLPDVVLRLVREMGRNAGVIGGNSSRPRPMEAQVDFAELDGDVERDFVVVLVAAPALGLQGMDQAGLDIFLDEFPRNIAVALGLERALAQLRRQRAGEADAFGGGGNFLRRCRSRPSSSENAHWPSSVVSALLPGLLFWYVLDGCFLAGGQLPRNDAGTPVGEGTACAPRTAMFALRPNTISARLALCNPLLYRYDVCGCHGNNGHKTMGAQSPANHRGELHVRRFRDFLKYSAATALTAPFVRTAAAQGRGPISRSAWSAQKPARSPGAAVTHFPSFKLWVKQVNDRGGLKLKGGQRKIELIEYDDRTQPPRAIKTVERLATVDKVDFIAAPYTTGINLATAPIFAKYNYPQIAQACVTDQGRARQALSDGFFIFQSPTSSVCAGRGRRAQEDEGLRPDRATRSQWSTSPTRSASNSPTPVGRCQGPASRSSMTRRIRSAHRTFADHQSRQGGRPGCVRRVVLSAGHLCPHGAGQDRGSERQSLTTARSRPLPGLLGQVRPVRPRTFSAPAADSPEIREYYKGTRKSPASMPTSGAVLD